MGLDLQYNTDRGITNNNNVGRHVTVMNRAVGVSLRLFGGDSGGGSFTFSRVAIPFVVPLEAALQRRMNISTLSEMARICRTTGFYNDKLTRKTLRFIIIPFK